MKKPNDTWHLFIFYSQGDLQTVVIYDSFARKILVLYIFHLNKRRTSPKGANEPQTLDPLIEWLNFMFKCTNIYLKKGTLLLWNLQCYFGIWNRTWFFIRGCGFCILIRVVESELGVGGVACFQLESVFKTAGVGVGVGFSKLLESESGVGVGTFVAITRLQCLLNNLNYNIN